MKLMRIILALAAAGLTAYGQSVSTAQINGTVRDATGAAVPNAEIKATQTDTGAVRTVTSDNSGAYVLVNLPIGPYRIEVSKAGFSRFVQQGIVLQVNTNPSIDPVMQVGALSEQVTVEAGAALVETHSSGVGQVVDNQRIVELPLNGRQASQLIYLSGLAGERNPGDTGNGSQLNTQPNYPAPVISIAGGLTNGVTYLLDGGTHNDPYNNLSGPIPFPDALQEFKVETSALPAQYGHHSSAAINAVTKSGTNQLHGSLFEFFRNGKLNARNFFDQRRQNLRRNQFGGTLGGPIKRDKLFFFAGYQGTIERADPTASVAFVPTADMLAGNFTNIASAACNAGVARTMPAAAGFQNNQISPALLNPFAIDITRRLNKPTNDPCGRVTFGQRSNTDEHLFIGRTDYQMSDKHSVFLRYQAAKFFQPTPFDGVTPLSNTGSTSDALNQSAVLGSTYLLTPNLVNSFRATFNRSRVNKEHEPFFSFADLGIPVHSEVPKFASLSVGGAAPAPSQITLGGGNAVPGIFNSQVFQIANDVSVIKGSHQIGFGVNWIRSMLNARGNLNRNGNFAFTGQALTQVPLADFVLGRPSNFQQGIGTTARYTGDYVGLYVQDSWRMSSRLTINYGVRWDPYFPVRNKYGYFNNFTFDRFRAGQRSSVYRNAPAGLIFPGDTGFPGNSAGFKQWRNLAPRVGLVWDPQGNGKMTIRASYGVFYDFTHLFYYWGVAGAAPFGALTAVPTPAGGLSNPWQGFAGGNPFPFTLSNNAPFYANQSYVNIPLEAPTTYVNQWNLSIQRQIGQDWMVSANYLGTGTVHLWSGGQANPAVFNPGGTNTLGNIPQRRLTFLANADQGRFYGSMIELDAGGTGSYQGMLLSVQRRARKGVTLQANYGWSHCISDLPNSEPGIQGQVYMLPNDRRSSRSNCVAIDRRHLLNASAVAQSSGLGNGWAKRLTADWQLSGIVRVQSANYFEVNTGVDNALTGQPNQRPNLVVANPYADNPSVDQWFRPGAFVAPTAGTYGNLGANNIRGPGRFTIDLGVVRNFRIKEGHSLQVRGEGFNIQNRLNPNRPVSAMNNTNFGRIISAADPRIIQLALRYSF